MEWGGGMNGICIWEAKKKYPDSASALDGWFRVMNKNKFLNYSELKSTFNSIDRVGNLYVFNIGGNKYRLVVSIHFNRQKVYIRDVLTHQEYDKDNWKQ